MAEIKIKEIFDEVPDRVIADWLKTLRERYDNTHHTEESSSFGTDFDWRNPDNRMRYVCDGIREIYLSTRGK